MRQAIVFGFMTALTTFGTSGCIVRSRAETPHEARQERREERREERHEEHVEHEHPHDVIVEHD